MVRRFNWPRTWPQKKKVFIGTDIRNHVFFARHAEYGGRFFTFLNFRKKSVAVTESRSQQQFGLTLSQMERHSTGLPYNIELFRTLYDMAPVGMIVATPEGRILIANPTYERILGYENYHLVGRNITEMTHPDDRQETVLELDRIRHLELPSYQMEKRYLHRDGHMVWVQVNAVMVKNDEGNPVCIIAQAMDISARKAAEQDLQRWEMLFRSTSMGVVLSYTSDLRMDLVNPAFAAMHGYREDELSGQPVSLVTPPAEHARIAAMIEQAESSGHVSYESFDVHKDGRQFPVLVDISVFHDENGKALYRVGNIVDISERKRTEDLIRASEARLNEAEKLAHLGSWEWDVVSGEQVWSDECYRIFGIPDSEKKGLYQRFLSLLAEDERARLQQEARLALQGDKAFAVEFTVTLADGCQRQVLARAEVFRDAQGQVVRMVGTNQDITDIRQAEQQLRESQQRFQALAENIPGVIFQASSPDQGDTFRFLYMSESSVHLFGKPAERCLDEPVAMLRCIHALDQETFEQSRRQSARELSVWNWEGRITTADGESIWINLRARPRISEGQVLWDGVILNITQHKQAEESIYLSRQLLRELAGEMEVLREHERKHIAREVHDELGQILTALRMDVSLLRMRFGAENPGLSEAVKNATDLVDHAIAAVRSVASDLRPAALDMGITDAIDWLLKEFNKRTGIRYQLDNQAGDIELEEKRSMAVFRIVQESLTNISRYAQATRVDISLLPAGDDLCIRVQDDGCGFDVAAAATKKTFGLLGMKERAITLGGSLNVDSAPGKGTSVLLTIPTHSHT